MYKAEFFIGFPIDSTFAKKLSLLDSEYLSLFIQNNEAYLREVEYENIRYLGKKIGDLSDVAALDLLEANIFSLLKKLIPEYNYQDKPLQLFPLLEQLPASPYAS